MSMQQLMLGVGASKKTYLDDIFSTTLYKGNDSSNTITTNIDSSSNDSLLWIKNRTSTVQHQLFDTVRGANKVLKSNANDGEYNGTGVYNQTFTSTGFTLNNSTTNLNSNNNDYSSWTFRKVKGFFDIVTYTGNGSSQNISHSLGCVPGMIMVKNTSASNDHWAVYHRNLDADAKAYRLRLDEDGAKATDLQAWNNTAPTSTQFTVGQSDETNENGSTIVAYLFAGGESGAATARSVDFDGTGDYLSTTSSSSDFTMGTGDFTVECWVRKDNTSNAQGIFQISSTSGGLEGDPNYANTIAVAYGSHWHTYGAGSINTDSSQTPAKKTQWQHVALVRSSGTSKLYVDGEELISYTDTTNYNGTYIAIGGYYNTTYLMDGLISNFRVVKGTAVYTSAFRPPTKPLTNISGTVLLCCNNSSITGSTVTPATLNSNGNPTASTDSPFDDPAGFKFGDAGDQNVIKCGSYVGSGSAGLEVNLGWEPQWVMVKNTTTSAKSWFMHDNMRGIVRGENEPELYANSTAAEASSERISLTPTGFKVDTTLSGFNTSGDTYIYICIRRPDGYVGKPADAGTDVFNVVYGNSSSNIPNFPANFPADLAVYKEPSSTYHWFTHTRLTGGKFLKLDETSAQSGSADTDATFDGNAGWGKFGYNTDKASWMWKRHAGFDVVTYTGNGTIGRQVSHSLGRAPEMIWVKRKNAAENWYVYHKGVNGGTNPADYMLYLNTADNKQDHDQAWNNSLPNSTHFILGNDTAVNSAGTTDYLAMLFASVDGISKVGYYAGSNSTQTITTGFQPRFVIIKNTTESGSDWAVFDTVRGWGSGADERLKLNSNESQTDDDDVGAPTSTGFTVNNIGFVNESGANYIYYAHA